MQAIYKAISILIQIIQIFIFIRVLLSYLPLSRNNPIIELIYEMTEPILAPCRELLYRIGLGGGMFDFSPLLALLILRLLQSLIFRIIFL